MSEQLWKQVASAAGWKRRKRGDTGTLAWTTPSGVASCDEPPALTLDWLHELESTLTGDQQTRYIAALENSARNLSAGWSWVMLHATAEQRARAFLATMQPK